MLNFTLQNQQIIGANSLYMYIADAQLESCIIQLIFASAENIQKTIGWTIFMLMKYPHVQTRCREEIMRVSA